MRNRNIDDKVKEIINKYQYDKSIRKYANKYFWNDNRWFRSVQSKQDVIMFQQGVRNTIDYYSKVYPLAYQDIEDLERALGKYEDAVKKVLQCYSDTTFDFVYSEEELMSLINMIGTFEKEISEVHMRKACQD